MTTGLKSQMFLFLFFKWKNITINDAFNPNVCFTSFTLFHSKNLSFSEKNVFLLLRLTVNWEHQKDNLMYLNRLAYPIIIYPFKHIAPPVTARYFLCTFPIGKCGQPQIWNSYFESTEIGIFHRIYRRAQLFVKYVLN